MCVLCIVLCVWSVCVRMLCVYVMLCACADDVFVVHVGACVMCFVCGVCLLRVCARGKCVVA